jgi:hypothetical protein
MTSKVVLMAWACVVAACSKSAAPTANAEFDKQWSALMQSGAEPVLVEGELHGAGLMGEVKRAVDYGSAGAANLVKQEIPGPLPDAEVVKGCYAIEERAGAVGSGKAILSIDIDPSGTVKATRVDAPAFSSSKLPSCISENAKAWTFPKFNAKEDKRFSYPFVFVGG